MEKIIITCVRHGQTQANKDGRFIGVLDQPLLESGRIQAKKTADHLKKLKIPFDVLISSPLKRCIQTAEIINENLKLELEINSMLKERNYGIFEGLSSEEVANKYPKIYEEYKKNKPFVSLPEGETAYDVENRVKDFIQTRLNNNSSQSNYLLVTHLNPIRALLRIFGLVDWDIYFRPFQNASITQIEINSNHAKIILFDEVYNETNICEMKLNPDC